MHWQFVSDWIVDFNTPGGVDRDGWQYAVGKFDDNFLGPEVTSDK